MLTKKQKQFFDKLKNFVEEEEYFPSVREIGKNMGFSSPATVHSYLQKLIREKKLIKDLNTLKINNASGCMVPLVGMVPAGHSFEIFEELGEEIELPEWMVAKGKNVFALKVKGDSMKDAYIVEDDIVVIKKSLEADPNEMVIALLEDNTITLKRLKVKNQKTWLIPENSNYDPIYQPFEIAGIVIGVLRSFN